MLSPPQHCQLPLRKLCQYSLLAISMGASQNVARRRVPSPLGEWRKVSASGRLFVVSYEIRQNEMRPSASYRRQDVAIIVSDYLVNPISPSPTLPLSYRGFPENAWEYSPANSRNCSRFARKNELPCEPLLG